MRAERTPLSGGQAANALAGAWHRQMGEPPSSRTLSILTAQWAHETGRGRAMLNFNFGGIKGSSPSGLTTSYRTREGSGDTEVSVIDGFRAYASAAEGASDYVGLLTRRYPEAVEAARTGDSAGFVRALKARGYFTGNANAYVKSVTQLSNRALVSGYDAIGARETGALALGAETAHAPPTPQVSHLLARASHSLASVTELLSGPEASVASSWGEEMDDAVRRTQLLMAALDLELDASHRRHDEMRR